MARNPAPDQEGSKAKVSQHVDLGAVRTELQRILGSATFAETDRLRKMLQFLVEETICGRGSTLKEYLVGVEVFGRPESFDPRNDSIVRVQARNLRKLLAQYYAAEGHDALVRISVPKGSYTPAFANAAPKGWRVAPKIVAGLLITVAVGVGLWAGVHWYRADRAASVAVLPFANLSGDSRYDYLAEGIWEDLTTGLAKVPRLKVMARTSASRFRRTTLDAGEVGRQLRVAALVEGSLRCTGNSVRVTAQLVSASDGFHLWSESYERPLDELGSIQAEIVDDVSRALDVKPRATDSMKWRPRHVVKPEARDLFLRGRFERARRKFGDLRAGMDCFERAIQIDPDFAEAYASLAGVHATIAFHDQESTERSVEQARALADRALKLNEDLPGVHMVKAQLAYFKDWDWATSDREFRRALELNPNYATAYQGHALSLMARGRFEDAMAASHKALELDPLSYTVSNDLGAILWAAGRSDEAIRRCREIVSLDPDFKPVHLLLGAIQAARGNYKDAIAEYEQQRRLKIFGSELLGRMGYAYAAAGRRADALAILSEMEAQDENRRVYAHLATLHAGLGDKQQALRCLEKSAQRRESEVVFINVEPHYSTLKKEARFQALCRRIGI